MLNSIKADYYRLVRSVGFWGIQAFCVLGILLAIFTSRLTTSSSGFFFAMDADRPTFYRLQCGDHPTLRSRP